MTVVQKFFFFFFTNISTTNGFNKHCFKHIVNLLLLCKSPCIILFSLKSAQMLLVQLSWLLEVQPLSFLQVSLVSLLQKTTLELVRIFMTLIKIYWFIKKFQWCIAKYWNWKHYVTIVKFNLKINPTFVINITKFNDFKPKSYIKSPKLFSLSSHQNH